MAIYEVTAPDGTVFELEGPDNATNEQIQEAAAAAFAEQSASKPEFQAEPKTTAEGLIGAATRGIAPIATGAALGAAAGAPFAGVGAIPGALAGAGAVGLTQLVGDPVVGIVNSVLGTDYQMPTEAMQDLMTRLGVAEPKTAAERVVQTLSSGAASAGGAIGLGRSLSGAASPTTAAIGSQLAAQPVAQVAGGAGAGAGSQLAAEMGGGPVAQLMGGIVGGITGASLGNVRGVQSPTENAAKLQAIQEAEKRGIGVMTTDVARPRTFVGKSAQTAGERIPVVGTGGMRQRQQAERIQAIRDTLVQFGADDAAKASDNVMADLLKTRGEALTKYSTQKNEVIGRLAGKGTVPVSNTVKAIDDEIAKIADNADVAEYASVIDDLTNLKSSIQGKNLQSIEQIREALGKKYAAPELSSIRGIAEKILTRIYAPLRNDMGDFIKNNGDRRDFTKWSVANKQLANMAGELDSGVLKSVLKRGDATPEVVQRMLFSQKPSEVRALYSQLSPVGKANARMAILSRAAEKATRETAEGTAISPEVFLNETKRLGGSIGVFFSGSDLRAVRGLTRALEITRRASEAGVKTQTGQELYMPAAFASFGGLASQIGLVQATGAAVGVGALARTYESKPVRDMLMKLPTLKRGSPEEAELAKRVIAALQAQGQTKEQE